MNNFNLYNPVNLCFGKDEHRQLSSLIPKDAKVLLPMAVDPSNEMGFTKRLWAR